MLFDRMAGGKPAIDVNTYSSPFDPTAGPKLREFMEKKGNKSGQMTKELFIEYLNELMAARRGQLSGNAGGPSGVGNYGGSPSPARSGPGPDNISAARQNLVLPAPLREELNLGKDQLAKLEQLEKETRKKMMDILKPDQKKKLEEMLDRGTRPAPGRNTPTRGERRPPTSEDVDPSGASDAPPVDR